MARHHGKYIFIKNADTETRYISVPMSEEAANIVRTTMILDATVEQYTFYRLDEVTDFPLPGD